MFEAAGKAPSMRKTTAWLPKREATGKQVRLNTGEAAKLVECH
jgi:hypothetical protein